MMAPLIDKLAAEYEGKVKIGKCNVDDNMSIAEKLNISSIPNMKIFVRGAVEESIVGVTSESALRDKLDEFCL